MTVWEKLATIHNGSMAWAFFKLSLNGTHFLGDQTMQTVVFARVFFSYSTMGFITIFENLDFASHQRSKSNLWLLVLREHTARRAFENIIGNLPKGTPSGAKTWAKIGGDEEVRKHNFLSSFVSNILFEIISFP